MADHRAAIKRSTDLQILSGWIEDGARVLDLGCGRGIFLEHLQRAKGCTVMGVDNSQKKVLGCVKRGVPVYQGDIDVALEQYDAGHFDWVVCSRTLQELDNPERMLEHATRVGRKVAVGFINMGFWLNRWHFLLHGNRIHNEVFPDPWYYSRPIQPVSIQAFRDFCKKKGIGVMREANLAGDWKSPVRYLANYRAGYALFELSGQSAVE